MTLWLTAAERRAKRKEMHGCPNLDAFRRMASHFKFIYNESNSPLPEFELLGDEGFDEKLEVVLGAFCGGAPVRCIHVLLVRARFRAC